jgi:hypothetical protein
MESRKITLTVFGATMALAGFLLFQVQPLFAKYILPWFGGGATVWIVCLLFFQLALLAGYAYAYAITLPIPVPRQVQLHVAILAVSLALLPITPADSWKPQGAGDPTLRILALLAVCVGVPYLALAATTPLLSRWLARIEPTFDPAPLFAGSNLGSFAGLLTYPFAFERWLSSPQQTKWWSWAYVVYAGLFVSCGLITLARSNRGQTGESLMSSRDPTPAGRVALWVALPGLGSVLLLATTNAVTQWSLVVPFLWIVPLSLYLLTFVIVFAAPRLYHRVLFCTAFPLLAGSTFTLALPENASDFLTQLAIHAAALFAGCMICHGELVRLRPEPEKLPQFYLAIAAGGAMGGVLVALVAPLIFNDFFEHPLALVVTCALAVALLLNEARSTRWIALVAGLAALYFLNGLVAGFWQNSGRTLVERVRNFYGVVKIVRAEKDNPRNHALLMMQAGVEQGGQYQSPERRMELICGYNESSALGLALAHQARRRAGGPQTPLRIGVIGLGVGMVAGLGRDGDTMRYYEINPVIPGLANRHFSFLKDGKAKTDILLGDGRLVLERQLKESDAQKFDVIVLNAFRGASPPLHLMTREAFDIYFGHLAENGILAVNFEFEVFDMSSLHRGLARQFGSQVRWFEPPDTRGCEGAIGWALYTRDTTFFEVPTVKRAISDWPDGGTAEIVWTDQDSNLMSIINWRGE